MPSIEDGSKTIELRIESAGNFRLIQNLLRYQVGDQLTFDSPGRKRGARLVATKVTRPTIVKSLGEVTDDDMKAIVGSLGYTREGLYLLLRGLYKTRVDDTTQGHLVFFERNT